MKPQIRQIGSRRKIIVIFVLAILLPSLIVGYLSLNTVLKRRDAVRKLLESNLWVSGEAALQNCERILLEREIEILTKKAFTPLYPDKRNDPLPKDSTQNLGVNIFLLDSEFHIVYPVTPYSLRTEQQNDAAGEVSQLSQEAEMMEFSRQDYLGAILLYEKYFKSATVQQKPLAMEGLARSLAAAGNYSRAISVYKDLAGNYSQSRNKSGHPYGITAGLQLAELEWRRNRRSAGIQRLLTIYEKLKAGEWILNQAPYDFFLMELKSSLDAKLKTGPFRDFSAVYQEQLEKPSTYEARLALINFINNAVIPSIKERITVSRSEDRTVIGRFQTVIDDSAGIVSFVCLPDFYASRSFYGGYLWNLAEIPGKFLQPMLNDLARESGLEFRLVSGDEAVEDERTRLLSFRSVPLPWELEVSHPEVSTVEASARREMVLYGSLLTVIVVLMVFGSLLIVRDIARESEATRLKTEFVHNISHELKTPLTLIRLYGETLQRKKNLSDKEKKEAYMIITKESERLSHMVNNVLDFSRIEMGRKEFHIKQGDLARVIRETLDSYMYNLEKRQFIVHFKIDPDLPSAAFDEEAMVSVFINLLSNAMKFSLKKRVINISLFQSGNYAVIQVEDNGIGISPGEHERIFQRFYRSDDDKVSQTGGSGLGLPLVKHIIEAHGGEVKVESELGKGSLFSVSIPLSGLTED